jgi:hypothetical protein
LPGESGWRHKLLLWLDPEEVVHVVQLWFLMNNVCPPKRDPCAKMHADAESVMSTSAMILYERPRTLTLPLPRDGRVPGK